MKEIMLESTLIEQRATILRDSCDQIEEKYYTRKFSQDETNGRREDLADVSIQMAEIESEFKIVRDSFKVRLKPLAEKKGKILQELKSGGEYIKSETYKFLDTDENKAAWYTPEGYKLEERDLRPEERQRTMFRQLSGTND